MEMAQLIRLQLVLVQQHTRVYVRGKPISIAEMVASVTGFTYSDWQGLDVAEYEIHINPSFGATATIDRNEATVKVFSSGQEISSRAFPVVKVGNIAKFFNPENIKNWSLQFVDIADNVEIEYDTTVKKSPCDAG